MVTHGGQDELVAGMGPAFEVGHLVDRHFLLPTAVVGQDADWFGVLVPEVERGEAVFAEEAGDVGAAIGGDQRVIGVCAHVGDLGDFRLFSGHVGNPGLARVPHGEDKAATGGIDKADGFAVGRDVEDHFQRIGVKDAHATGFIV